MKTPFVSKFHPEMNPFLTRLEKALENLPNNPKPACEGFFITEFDFQALTLTTEKIGYVPREKQEKYFKFSLKKVIQTLHFGKIRSKDFEDDKLEQYPGAIKVENDCAGVSAHESMVDEAISLIWQTIKDVFILHDSEPSAMHNRNFWQVFRSVAQVNQQRLAPDNIWVIPLSELLVSE